MPHFTFRVAVAAVVLPAFVSLAGAEPLPERIKGIHDDTFRPPQVVSAGLSADNSKVAVSYFVHARNRPGTDWGSFAAVWDLESGKRVIITSAMGPVAVSPDGQWVASGHYVRDRRERGFNWSPAQLAVWKFGEAEPAHRFVVGDPDKDRTALERRMEAPNPVVIAFHPSSKHVAWLNQSGQVLLANVEEKKQPVVIAQLEVNDEMLWRSPYDPQWPGLAFTEKGAALSLEVKSAKAGELMLRTVKWKVDASAGKAEQVSDEAKKVEVPPAIPLPRKVTRVEPLRFHSADKSIRLVAETNGVVELFKGEEKESFKTLRLDD